MTVNHLSTYYLDKGKEERPQHITGSYYVPAIEFMALYGGHKRIFSHLPHKPVATTIPSLEEKESSETLNLTEIWAQGQTELGHRPFSVFHAMKLLPATSWWSICLSLSPSI